MKEIKYIVEDIREELKGAEHYAKIAAKLKAEHSSNASVYAEMARQELGHVDELHKMAVKAIERQRDEGVTPPAAMQAVWDWEHENMMEKTAKIRTLLAM